MELIDRIGNLPPLADLPRERLLRLVIGARLEQYPPAAELFRQAEIPKYLHLLLSGMVKLWTSHHAGAGTIHEVLRPGGIFVLPAVISRTPYVVGAAAITQAEIVLLPAERICKNVLTSPDLAAMFLHYVSHQYQRDQLRCIEIFTLTTTQRLGRFLLRLANEQNNKTITLPYSKRLLAAQLQMTPESLSRALSKLKPFIAWRQHLQIRIKNMKGLINLSKPNDCNPGY